MLDFRDKKRSPNNGTAPGRKECPINSKAEGKKKKCPGNEKVQKTYKFEGAEKKECPREVFSLLLRHSAFVK